MQYLINEHPNWRRRKVHVWEGDEGTLCRSVRPDHIAVDTLRDKPRFRLDDKRPPGVPACKICKDHIKRNIRGAGKYGGL